MPRKHVFGLTAWGRYFVDAMEALGDPGRLERGRAYAGKGRVSSLSIGNGLAKARVEGNYRPYYSVKISFPPFSAAERRGLEKLVGADPLELARVRAGELPPGLLDHVERAGISLFPRRWSEMKRSCDCPDSGDPCKHEAAVYYVIAQEIDRDPSVLFRLRGFDPAASSAPGELAGRAGPAAKPAADGEEPTVLEPLELREADTWTAPDPADYPAELPSLASYGALLPRILPPGPALAGLDLEVALAEFYHCLSRDWEKPLAARPPASSRPRAAAAPDEEAGREAAARSFALAGIRVAARGQRGEFILPGGARLSPLEAARLVLAMDLESGSPSYVFLRRFSLAMRSIVAAGAFHPDIRAGDGRFSALWLPARFAADAREALAWVEAAAVEPERSAGPRAAPAAGTRTSGKATLDPPSLVALFASTFLGDYVAALAFRPSGSLAAASPAAKALFGGEEVDASSPLLRSLPRALAARFSVYRLAARRSGFELAAKPAASRSGAPVYRLKASVLAPEGGRLSLREAGALLGADALAFPALLSNFVPGLAALGAKASVALSEEELGRLVVEAAPLLSRIGVSVVLPKELSRLARPRLRLGGKRRKGSGPLASLLGLDSAFSFEWKVELGGELVDAAEFEALVAKGEALVRFRDRYVRLEPGEAAALLERLRREREPDAMAALRAAVAGEAEPGGELELAVGALLPAARAGGGAAERDSGPPPEGLLATLRPYQERGFRWLLSTLRRGSGCLLADDMGLGKTVQAIAVLLALKEAGELGDGALVVAPAGLLTNWERELARFAPSLSVHSQYGPGRRLRAADVVLTTYETLARDGEKLSGRAWSVAVLDEAHLVKNPDARRSRAAKALKAKMRLALTGTPVENNLAELWSVFDFVLPGYLGTLARFASEYRNPIEVGRDRERAERLRRLTAPFLLRRLKTDKAIAPDLPEKVVIEESAELTAEQAALYGAAVSAGLASIEASEGIERRGRVLALVTALKQIANHPRNWDKESPASPERSGKVRLLLALLDAAMASGERVLVFSQYVEMLDILAKIVRGSLSVEPFILHGGMSKAKRDEAVDRFQSGSGPGVFLVSLKAGGVGLNLTAATRVIHYDLWFNPAVESQATDRAFRIGQTRDVFVHRLVTKGTLEERIDAALASKRELADLAVGAGETWLSELGNAELKELVALR